MKFKYFLNEEKLSYNNWVRYTPESLKSDFVEYKKKENNKWKNRANRIGSRFPIFNSLEHFKEILDKTEIKNLTDSMDRKINNRSRTDSIEDLKGLVSGYVRPRDVDKIVKGYESGARIPLPIVIEGDKGSWIMAGNTRLDVAFILGVQPKVLWVKVGIKNGS
jgi:hypothetical protein